MKRRDLVAILEANGFKSIGGTKHEKFTNGAITVQVKRHREIADQIAKRILREAGLRYPRRPGRSVRGAEMFYIREFEFFEDSDGFVCAIPFDLGEGTFGDNMEDALESAADYMFGYVTDCLIRGEDVADPTFGNAPAHGGKVIALAVDCDLSKVETVTAADAARMLGVSSARVSQLCDAGLLQSWREGTKRLITLDSVNARLQEGAKRGRPRKAAASA